MRDGIKELPLFTYGSLMENLFNYEKYLKGYVKGQARKARIKGRLFHLKDKRYPALLAGEDWVYGEIVELINFSKEIDSVDGLENYYGANDGRNEYERKAVEVEVYNEKTKQYDQVEAAYCYWYVVEHDPLFDKQSLYLKSGNWRHYHEEQHQLI